MFSRINNRSRLLMKYIRINFIAIFLPVTIISVVYCFAIQNNYEEKYLDAIEYSINEKMWQIESRMESISSMANQISLDKELTPYSLKSSSYAGRNAIQKLSYYKAEANHFDELVICLEDSEILYTNNGVVDMDVFVGTSYSTANGFSEEEFKQLLDSKEVFGSTKEGQYITSKIYKYGIITYPLGRLKGNVYGTLIGIYELDWEKLIGNRFVENEEGIAIVCTNATELIYTQIPEKIRQQMGDETDLTEPLYQLLENWDENQGYCEFTLFGEKYVGKVVQSEVSGWYLIDMVEEDVVNRDFLMMQLPMLIIISLAMLLLTIFLSMVLSMYNYLPIQRIYHLFDKKELNRNHERENDELLFLNEYIRELLEEQETIEKRLAVNEQISRKELVKRLLRSSLDVTLPEVKEQLDGVGIHLDKEYMAAMVVKFNGKTKKNFEIELKCAIYESRYNNFYLTENIYKEYDAFLICTEDVSEIDEFAEWLTEQMEEENGIQIGIGDAYGAADSLKYSLMEAIIAVESKESQVAHFSDMTTQRKGEFYCKPLESEMKLKQLLVSGEAERLDTVLRELRMEFLYIGKSCSDTMLVFLMNRVFASLFENALCLDETVAEKYLHYTNLEEFLELLREFCFAELECRREQKVTKEDSRIKDIIAFIDDNYMHQEMSLALVAEKFHMTGPYLSRIFKAATGKNFLNYITDKRLELAAQLLVDTDDSVGEIVEKVGYSDGASFTRKFSRHFLVSPGNYRKMEREKIRYNVQK